MAIPFPLVARARPLLLCGLLLSSLNTWAATPEPPPAIGAISPTAQETTPAEVIIEAAEPKYVAPTLRDRIGRIWAPVLINGKGPYRLVLTQAPVTRRLFRAWRTALESPRRPDNILVRGVTGSAVVPAVRVDRMEVGDLLIEPSTLPIVPDVFGGAEGVLGRRDFPTSVSLPTSDATGS